MRRHVAIEIPMTRYTHSLEQVRQRMMSKVEMVSESGCWIWMGANKGDREYGRVYIGRKKYHAHRMMYELTFGQIEDGLVIDHLCRVHSCINPYHLEVVTSKENILRGVSVQALNSKKTHCKRGHLLDADNLLPVTGSMHQQRSCRTCRNTRQRAGRSLNRITKYEAVR